jgi:hypothetical protein
MSFDARPFNVLFGLRDWSITFGSFAAIVLVVSFLTLLAARGRRGPGLVVKQLVDGVRDLLSISFRRTWAIAVLTIRESVRRKALLVFVIFAFLFMFAGWFLSGVSQRPEMSVKVYVSFVLTAISWLILPVALLLACWGLPDDIKARSLHTVVTKPVRRGEIVLGRILGYVTVNTIVLLLMAGIGYLWIVRQVPAEVARTNLICRVPVYGELRYLDREGVPGAGTNVGYMWEFRGYIEGATQARAIWDFAGISPKAMVTTADNQRRLLLESRFEAFRTHKGDMARTVICQIELVNPKRELRVKLPSFEVSEFGYNLTPVERELSYYDEEARETKSVDLFDDLVDDGRLTAVVQCLDPGQYLGMARPDLFIRMPDRHFAVGFFKAVAGVWLQMVLITVLGVTASCFLKGPVAALLTFTLILIGQTFQEFLFKFVGGKVLGGGPIEQMIRVFRHMNEQTELNAGPLTGLIQGVDEYVFRGGLWLVSQVIPQFSYFRMSPYVANGFDVPWSAALLPSIAVTLGYLVPCLLIGYYALKLRELETK